MSVLQLRVLRVFWLATGEGSAQKTTVITEVRHESTTEFSDWMIGLDSNGS